MEVKYKIYVEVEGWQYITAEPTMEKVIRDLDFLLFKQNIEHYIVVESNDESDFPVMTTIDDYVRIKRELQDVSRGIKKLYKGKKL